MSIERLKEIDSILRAESWYSYCDRYQALPKTWVDLGKALPKLLAVVEAADQAVETLDKLFELTDTFINVNISGKDYRFDVTKELKQKLAALKAES